MVLSYLLAEQFVIDGPPMVLKAVSETPWYLSIEFWVHTLLDAGVAGGTIYLAAMTRSLAVKTAALASDASAEREQTERHHRQEYSSIVLADTVRLTESTQRVGPSQEFETGLDLRGIIRNIGGGPAMTNVARLRLPNNTGLFQEAIVMLPSIGANSSTDFHLSFFRTNGLETGAPSWDWQGAYLDFISMNMFNVPIKVRYTFMGMVKPPPVDDFDEDPALADGWTIQFSQAEFDIGQFSSEPDSSQLARLRQNALWD